MIFGLSVYLFIRITIVSKKLDRLIRDIIELKIELVNLLVILMILLERKFND